MGAATLRWWQSFPLIVTVSKARPQSKLMVTTAASLWPLNPALLLVVTSGSSQTPWANKVLKRYKYHFLYDLTSSEK